MITPPDEIVAVEPAKCVSRAFYEAGAMIQHFNIWKFVAVYSQDPIIRRKFRKIFKVGFGKISSVLVDWDRSTEGTF